MNFSKAKNIVFSENDRNQQFCLEDTHLILGCSSVIVLDFYCYL